MTLDRKLPEKGLRITVDFTPRTAQELDRLRKITGLQYSDLLREGMSSIRRLVDAYESGGKVLIYTSNQRAMGIKKFY